MRLLVGLLVGQLLRSFYNVWYDLPTNSVTSYPTNNRISWIWMRKKIGLNFTRNKCVCTFIWPMDENSTTYPTIVAMLPYLFIEPIIQQFSSFKDLFDLIKNDVKGKKVYKVRENNDRIMAYHNRASYHNRAFSYS